MVFKLGFKFKAVRIGRQVQEKAAMMQAYQTSTVDTLFEDIKTRGFDDIVSLNDLARLDKIHRSLIPLSCHI